MSWRLTTDYTRREQITVINTGGVSAFQSYITIPPDLDSFWESIDDNGYGIRVSAGDGYTDFDYAIDNGSGGAFNATAKANRTGRILVSITGAPGTTDEALSLWLYYGISSPTDGSTVIVPSSPVDGYIDRASPRGHVIEVRPPRPGLDRPADVVEKREDSDIVVWLSFASFLEQRGVPFSGRRKYEEVAAVYLQAADSGGTAAPTLLSLDECRFVEVGTRLHPYFRAKLTGGTDGTNYTVRATLITLVPGETSAHRTEVFAFGVRVKNLLEPAS